MVEEPLIDFEDDGERNDQPGPLVRQVFEAGPYAGVIGIGPVGQCNKRTSIQDDARRLTALGQSSGPLPGPGQQAPRTG